MSDPPLVTVFTTFTDNIAWIDETIASVLAQTFQDFELLLLSDGSPDESERLARLFPDQRIRLVTHRRTPLAEKRQQGLVLARGRYVAVLDSDDVSEPERLATQIAYLEAHPECVAVGSAILFIDENSQPLGYRRYPEEDAALRALLPEANCLAHSSVTMRKDAALAAGGYTTEFIIEDYDLWLRIARHGRLHNLPEPLTRYRIHSASIKSRKAKASLWDTVRLQVKAVRAYGYPLRLRTAASIALHALLMLLPTSVLLWTFERTRIKR